MLDFDEAPTEPFIRRERFSLTTAVLALDAARALPPSDEKVATIVRSAARVRCVEASRRGIPSCTE